MKNKYLLLIISLLSLLSGFWLSVLIKKWFDFSISNSVNIEVNPLDLIGFVLTFIIAIYVTRKLTKDNEREKAEKELLISYFNDFRNSIKQVVSKIIDENSFDTIEVKSKFKILRKTLESNINLAENYSFINENFNTTKKLKEYLTDIWELVTEKPVEDKIEFTKQEIMKKIILLDEEIFKVILEINKK